MSYTTVDQLNALQYAKDRLTQELCTSPTFLNKFCGDEKGDCLKWSADDSLRSWQHICVYDPDKKCTNDNQCGGIQSCINNPDNSSDTQKYCGFCTNGQKSGHCKINREDVCVKNSTLPYTCNNAKDKCDFKSKEDLAKSLYTEWNEESQKCIYGNFLKRMYAENPLARGNVTDKNEKPFNYDAKTGQMHITKDYCLYHGKEYGSGSCEKKTYNIDAKDPKDPANCYARNGKNLGYCHGSVDSGTNVCAELRCLTDIDCRQTVTGGAFDKCVYSGDKSYGICEGVDPVCKSDLDCKAPDRCIDGTCNGDSSNCWTTVGQDVGEFFIGKTIFNGFSKLRYGENPFTCNENYQEDGKTVKQFLKETFDMFDKTPEVLIKLADSKYMTEKKLFTKDFAGPGINLYYITWKPETNMKYLQDTGFDANEVQKIFPHIVKNIDGKKQIVIHRNQLVDTDVNYKNLKRIYLTMNSSKWMLDSIIKSNTMLNKK